MTDDNPRTAEQVAEANERLRRMCIKATEIADEQGWEWAISSRIGTRTGWMVTVYTDKVRTPKRAMRHEQLSIPTGEEEYR